MSYICKEYKTFEVLTTEGYKVLQMCTSWFEHTTLIEMLAITREQMIMLTMSILGIYSLIIAFVLFNNFAKRA